MNNYKSELNYLMKYYGLKFIPIYIGEEFLGKVELNGDTLRYNHDRTFRYYTHDDYAFDTAREQIEDVVKAYRMFNENKQTTKTYLKINDGKPTEDSWSGSICEVMENLYAIQHRYQYCNDIRFKFKEEEDRHLYRLWLDYIDSKDQSLSLYMRNGGDMW